MKSTYRNLAELFLAHAAGRARRMRQEELGRLLRKAAQAVNAAYHRAVSQFSAKGVRHAQ